MIDKTKLTIIYRVFVGRQAKYKYTDGVWWGRTNDLDWFKVSFRTWILANEFLEFGHINDKKR